jgi:hypothetical protein
MKVFNTETEFEEKNYTISLGQKFIDVILEFSHDVTADPSKFGR